MSLRAGGMKVWVGGAYLQSVKLAPVVEGWRVTGEFVQPAVYPNRLLEVVAPTPFLAFERMLIAFAEGRDT